MAPHGDVYTNQLDRNAELEPLGLLVAAAAASCTYV